MVQGFCKFSHTISSEAQKANSQHYNRTRKHQFDSGSVLLLVMLLMAIWQSAEPTMALTITTMTADTRGMVPYDAISEKIINHMRSTGLQNSLLPTRPDLQQEQPTRGTRSLHRRLLAQSRSAAHNPGSSDENINMDQAMRALVGSSPPKCVKKCGACTPCRSVLVPIHTINLPATPAEYYPEAWRCQCKGKIYNP